MIFIIFVGPYRTKWAWQVPDYLFVNKDNASPGGLQAGDQRISGF